MVRTPGGSRSRTLTAAALGQLGDGVGGVVGPHVGDDVGHLLVGLVLEEPVGDVGVELLEHVRFELGVGVHHVEDLLALLAGGVLEQVGDLRRLEPAHPAESWPGPARWRVWPISGSNAFQSWQGCPPELRISPKSEAGRRVSRQDTTQPSSVCTSSMSQARTSSASATSISRCPRMSSRSSTSPSRRSKPRRSTLGLARTHLASLSSASRLTDR